ncbi:DUF6542 domain-containing protein [Nakamurella aerolata]|uniref:DUF6542 domain-containing protein n=1 Tax=Nakamurella aerolata TaxID=1656892 RepID=A0A849A9X8_9ACTN|nr:DUF6542 domain-containing protein [Nakamurella aerolata]NNG35290.1 hypothetical protein [Nakamurella aerolata]
MTTTSPRPADADAKQAAHASVVPSIAGVPWWGVVLISIVGVVLGLLIGTTDFADGVPTALWIFFLAGTVIAVLAARRQTVFTGMVQPPLVLAVATFIGSRFSADGDNTSAALDVVKTFPLMATATAVAVVLGVARLFAQPLGRQNAGRAGDPAGRNPADRPVARPEGNR